MMAFLNGHEQRCEVSESVQSLEALRKSTSNSLPSLSFRKESDVVLFNQGAKLPQTPCLCQLEDLDAHNLVILCLVSESGSLKLYHVLV